MRMIWRKYHISDNMAVTGFNDSLRADDDNLDQHPDQRLGEIIRRRNQIASDNGFQLQLLFVFSSLTLVRCMMYEEI